MAEHLMADLIEAIMTASADVVGLVLFIAVLTLGIRGILQFLSDERRRKRARRQWPV